MLFCIIFRVWIFGAVLIAGDLFLCYYLHISKISCTFAAVIKTFVTMRHFYLLAICAIMCVTMCACTDPNSWEPVVLPSIPTEHCSFKCATNGRTVSFFNTSSAGLEHFVWNFGDGATSTENDPVHTYSASGNYTATLTGYNNNKAYTCSAVIKID